MEQEEHQKGGTTQNGQGYHSAHKNYSTDTGPINKTQTSVDGASVKETTDNANNKESEDNVNNNSKETSPPVNNATEKDESSKASNEISDNQDHMSKQNLESAEGGGKTMNNFQAKCDELQQKYDDMYDKFLRLNAEFDNYRKRVAKERQDWHNYGFEPLLSELLVVLDTLEIALTHTGENNQPDVLSKGIEMTVKEIKKVFSKYGVTEILCEGKPFDPNYQQAMTEVERDDVPDKTVVEQMRKGYTFKDRLLRAALVSVSKKKSDGAG